MSDSDKLVDGIVVRSTGSWHDVLSDGEVVPSRVRGKLRLVDRHRTNPVAVGDQVQIRVLEDGAGQIEEIYRRRNELSRRAAGRRSGLEHVIAANVDHTWVVQAISFPKPNPGFIDRLLIMSGVGGIPAGVIINKIDLIDTDADAVVMERIIRTYADLGYPVIQTSAETGQGISDLRSALHGKTSVICGPSGVGKSSILNRLDADLSVRTGEVSEKTRKGRHTTAVACMYWLEDGTALIDTPGVREIGLWSLTPVDLGSYMPEFKGLETECRFPDCTHDHEPKCAVREAAEAGDISEGRYLSYLNMLESLRAGKYDVGR